MLHLKQNRVDQVAPLLATLEAKTKDEALLAWLKADYLLAKKQPDDALVSYERAISLERDEEQRATMHFHAAFAYAMAAKLNDRQQGDGMVRHLEDAIHLRDNPVLRVLKGYGWALRRNLAQFEAEFAKVDVVLASMDPAEREGVSAFARNWKGRALRKLGQSSKAAEDVLASMDSAGEEQKVPNLLVLAGASLDMAGFAGDPKHLADAERYAEQIIALQPSNGEAYKYRALVNTLRAEHASDEQEGAQLSERARNDFLKAIRLDRDARDARGDRAACTTGNVIPSMPPAPAALAGIGAREIEANAYQALSLFDRDGDLAAPKRTWMQFQAEMRKSERSIACWRPRPASSPTQNTLRCGP